jgi:hypothetical protein
MGPHRLGGVGREDSKISDFLSKIFLSKFLTSVCSRLGVDSTRAHAHFFFLHWAQNRPKSSLTLGHSESAYMYFWNETSRTAFALETGQPTGVALLANLCNQWHVWGNNNLKILYLRYLIDVINTVSVFIPQKKAAGSSETAASCTTWQPIYQGRPAQRASEGALQGRLKTTDMH